MLFAKKDTGYNVHIGRFKTPSYIIDDRMFNGTLFDVVEQAVNYMIGHLKVAFEITGKTTRRNEIFEYPLSALRELVLNAIVHRDYLSPTDIQIKIFDKRISFFNPGKLYGDLKIEDLKRNDYQASTRNKLIAEAFYLTGEIEKYGSGFIRIREAIKDYPSMQFKIEERSGGFLSELQYVKQKDSSYDGVNDGVNAVLSLIKQFPGINTTLLLQKMEVSKRTIERWIKKLREANLIEFRGAPKTGGYYIKPDKN